MIFTPAEIADFLREADQEDTLSTVTIFCRDGACNVASHNSGTCYNRYVATRGRRVSGPPLTRRDWEALRDLR